MTNKEPMMSYKPDNDNENRNEKSNNIKNETSAYTQTVEALRRGRSDGQLRQEREKFMREIDGLEEKFSKHIIGEEEYSVARSILQQGVDLLSAALGDEGNENGISRNNQ